MPTVNQTSGTPTTKVQAATALAAVASLLSWADDKFLGDQVPGFVEAALITLAVFLGGYLVKNRSTDAPPAPGVADAGHVDLAMIAVAALVALAVVLLVRLLA